MPDILIIVLVVAVLVIVVALATRGRKETVPARERNEADNIENSGPQTAAEADLDEEIVAAISAAVAVMMEPSKKAYTIKSISRISGGRPAWATAARNEQIYSRF
ncbi:MAG: hypothetical protein ACOYJD_04790 [Christensenellales bacterium]|jgi:Tfp pilus assembly protein PilX